MARPNWKGNITFGLVNVPVTLYSVEKRTDLHFNLLDSRNMARVRYERVNEETGESVPWNEIVKAYEFDDGNYVVLEEEDFKRAAVEATKAVEIEDFVDGKEIEYAYYDKPYILVPGKKGEKGYAILREALRNTGKVGVAKVVIRTRQYLAALIPEGNALILELLRFHQELRSSSEFDLPGSDLDELKITKKEMEMAEQLVENMSTDWEPQKYRDEYREALLAYIEQKMKQGGKAMAPQPEAEEKAGRAEVIDLMDVLKKSVQQTQKKRGSTAGKSGSKSETSRRRSPGKSKTA
jgi:DNA end-binding protein Ku